MEDLYLIDIGIYRNKYWKCVDMCGNPLSRKRAIEKTFSVIIGPEDKEQREMIFNYIAEHHGCKAKDIIHNFKNTMGEKKVRSIVRKLEHLNLIKNESKNNRDKVYFVNKENEFIKSNNKIRSFSEKYSLLIKHCKDNHKLAKIKDILNREKIGSLESEQNRVGFNFIIAEYHKSEKIFDRIYYLIIKINQCFNEISNLDEEVSQSSSQKIKEYGGIIIPESKKITSYEITSKDMIGDHNPGPISFYHKKKLELVKIIDKSIRIINQLLARVYKISSKNCGLVRINFWNIYVFILFTHYINFYNVMRWPFIISDKTMRNNLNTLLYEKILDLNNSLNEYQSSNKSLSKIIYSLIKGEQFRSFMNINEQKYYQMMTDYQIFDLGQQIKEILALSLLSMNMKTRNLFH